MGLHSPGTSRSFILAARLGLAAAAFSTCAPLAAHAETLTVTDITASLSAEIPGVTTSFSVPTVELTDASIDEATVRAVFSGDLGVAAPALVGLDATRIFIPEINLTFDVAADPDAGIAAQQTTVTYRDLEMSEIADGVAASTRIGSGSSTVLGSSSAEGPQNVTVEFGEISTGRFDIGALLGFYGYPAAGADPAVMKPIYNDLNFAGISLTADEFSCGFEPVQLAEFRARPLQHPLADVTALILQAEAAEEAGTPPPPETVRNLVDIYIDLFTAFESTPLTLGGFTCSGADDEGKPMSITSGPITVAGFEPGVYPQFALDDLRVEVVDEGWLELGNFTFKPMDFSNAIETLKNATEPLDEAWFAANARKLIPAFDGLSLADFSMDIPDADKEGERLQAKLGGLDITLADYVNGIPAAIALTAANLIISIPEGLTEGPGPELRANGITEVDLNLGSRFHWERDAGTIEVEDLTVDAGQLGRVTVTGTLGNATEALFADDPEAATLAAMQLTLKTVTIDIDDRGMGPMLVAAGAREAGQPVASFRMAMGGMLQGMTLAVLGNSDEALKAAQALGAFIGGAPELTVTLTAIDPAGLGLADLAGLETDPTSLAGKVSVTATAGGEPLPTPEPAAPGSDSPAPNQP